jgi:flavodoxin
MANILVVCYSRSGTTLGVARDIAAARVYELVVLGTPVWAGSIASPMRSYLFLHRLQFRQVAFFATMGAVGAGQTFSEMKLLCHRDDAPTCAFTQADVEANRHRPALDAFITQIRAAVGRTTASQGAAA